MKIDDLFYPPYTRVLERASGWMTLDEVRESVATVRGRGGDAHHLDDVNLAEAHPGRVHAILQGQASGFESFYEIRLWDTSAGRSWGCPIDLTPDEAVSFPAYPDPVYHELVGAMDRGYFTE